MNRLILSLQLGLLAMLILPSVVLALEEDEIRDVISGKTAHIHHTKKNTYYKRYFGQDGILLEDHPDKGVRKGIWTINSNKLCTAFEGSSAKCRPFMEKDGNYGAGNKKGTKMNTVFERIEEGNQIKLPRGALQTADVPVIHEELVTINTREDITQTFLLIEPVGKPKGVIVLYPGHEGVVRFKKLGNQYIVDNEGGGLPAHEKSRQILSRAGYAVAVLAPPSDKLYGMDTDFRFSKLHANDAEKVIDYLNNKYNQDVYLHGHCRSSFSPSAVATQLKNKGIKGIILSSTRSEGKHGSVMDLQQGAIKVPILLVHHIDDPCDGTPYAKIHQVKSFYEVSAPKVDLITVSGGDGERPANASGCSGGHHAFKGQRKSAMNAILDWLNEDPFPKHISD